MCDESLCAEVVLERERFDELLDAAADIPLVAPGVYALHVVSDGDEELGDLVEAGLVFRGDFVREWVVDCADALEGENTAVWISAVSVKRD